MPRLPRGSALAVAPVLIWLALAQIKETAQPQPTPYRISGRVEELYPGLGLMLGSAKGETSYAKVAVPVAPDGAFVTRPLASGVHVLELVEPSSPEPTSRGVRIVHVTSSDINGIVLRPLPRYALTGRFRMESDNRAAVWPPHIVVDRDHDRLYVKATGSAGGWHPETWLFEYHLRQRREMGGCWSIRACCQQSAPPPAQPVAQSQLT